MSQPFSSASLIFLLPPFRLFFPSPHITKKKKPRRGKPPRAFQFTRISRRRTRTQFIRLYLIFVIFFLGDTHSYVLVILLDWEAYLREDMTTSTRINAFLWNRVSQGYSRVVKDEPPFESWRAWRAGHRDHKLVLYFTPTPSPSPVRELPSDLDGSTAAADSVADQAKQGSSSNRGGRAGGCDTAVRTVTAAPASTSSSSSSSTLTAYSESAVGSRCGVGVGVGVGGIGGDGNEEVEELEFEFSGYEKVPTAALTGPPNLQVWAFPSLGPEQSQSQSSEGSTNTTSESTSTGGQKHLRPMQVSFKLDAREDMELDVVLCTFTRMEDVRNFQGDFSKHVPHSHNLWLPYSKSFLIEPKLKLAYPKKLSS